MLKLLGSAAALALVVGLATPASAAMPVTRSRPFRAVCQAQGGMFSVAVDARSLYCDKLGGLFTAFSDRELSQQRRLCTRVYGASFGVQGFERDGQTGTGTFCYMP